MQQLLNNYKGVYQKTTEFDEKIRVIAELTDEKSDLEIELLNMRAKLRTATENEEATKIKMNDFKQLEEDLKGQYSDKLSTKLIDMSQKLQEIRLSEFKAKRRADEEERKNEYFTQLHKSIKEQVMDLEARNAKLEGDLIAEEEKYRQRDNERWKKFANRYQDIGEQLLNNSQSQINIIPSARPDFIDKQLEKSVNLSVTETTRLGVKYEEKGIENQ